MRIAPRQSIAVVAELGGVLQTFVYRYDMCGEAEMLEAVQDHVVDDNHPMDLGGLKAILDQL